MIPECLILTSRIGIESVVSVGWTHWVLHVDRQSKCCHKRYIRCRFFTDFLPWVLIAVVHTLTASDVLW